MNILTKISGSIIIIGSFKSEYLSENLTDIFYVTNKNSDSSNDSSDTTDVASDVNLKDLHKHFKDGIDNIYAEYEVVKEYYPTFIRESLKIAKKEIYISFDDNKYYEYILKKYLRFNLNISKHKVDDQIIMKIECKKNSTLKRQYYYIIDEIGKWYNYISDNF